MLTVALLAKKSGNTPHAVRYYSRIGLLSPTRNPENGYRQYKPSDVSWLRFIRQAKELGYTLHEIQEIMQDRVQGNSPCPKVREILQRRIVENRHHLQELLQLQDRMEAALVQWSNIPDSKVDDHSVCHLIESVISSNTEKKPN
jgi:DNA-binding transcriptional MerR regulator